jgi:hypothetical protein
MPLRFDCSSLSGIFISLLSVLLAITVIFVVPATFWMVLWNAVVFEGLHGPFIALHQGLLLWIATLIVLKLVFNPQIVVVWDEWDDEDAPKGTSGKMPKTPKPPKP